MLSQSYRASKGKDTGIWKSKILFQGGNRSGEQNVGDAEISEKKDHRSSDGNYAGSRMPNIATDDSSLVISGS